MTKSDKTLFKSRFAYKFATFKYMDKLNISQFLLIFFVSGV